MCSTMHVAVTGLQDSSLASTSKKPDKIKNRFLSYGLFWGGLEDIIFLYVKWKTLLIINSIDCLCQNFLKNLFDHVWNADFWTPKESYQIRTSRDQHMLIWNQVWKLQNHVTFKSLLQLLCSYSLNKLKIDFKLIYLLFYLQ